ncbi:MAG: hypothetical protein LBM23_08625 [Propionibacteriaceae bacterium]|jgi:ABC-type multidrug transport system permease subunit|nr:hypothetical protein [Propionibacteriaceae bacterium]
MEIGLNFLRALLYPVAAVVGFIIGMVPWSLNPLAGAAITAIFAFTAGYYIRAAKDERDYLIYACLGVFGMLGSGTWWVLAIT